MDSPSILLLWIFGTKMSCKYPRDTDTVVSHPYKGDGNPNIDVSTCMLVGLLLLFGKETHKAF